MADAGASSRFQPTLRWLAAVVVLAAAYAATGRLGLLLAIPPGYATAVWPPSGIALAAILIGGARLWPGILLGSILVNAWTAVEGGSGPAVSVALAALIGCGASAQALLGAALVRIMVKERNIFQQEIGVAWTLLLGGPASCLVNATVGVTALAAAGAVPADSYPFTWWTWWVGDCIGVIVFAPLVLAWSVRPWSRWLRKQVLVTAPLAGLFATVVWLFVFTSNREELRMRARFERDIETYTTELARRQDEYVTVLQAMEGFFAGSESVSRAEFRVFTDGLRDRLAGVVALSYDERVTLAGRNRFVQAVRAEGFRGFDITELGDAGRLAPAPARPEYVAIRYIEPPDNTRVLGFDVASSPGRRIAFERSRDTGAVRASDVVPLVQDARHVPGILMALPVYRRGAPLGSVAERRAALVGYVTAVIRISELMGSIFASAGADDGSVHVRLIQDSPGAAGATLYSNVDPVSRQHVPDGFVRTVPVDWAGRPWTLEFTLPDDYVIGHRSWQSWGLLATGLLVCGMLGMTLLILVGRQAQVEALVAEQTAGMRLAEERFRAVLETAPDAMVIVGEGGLIELVNAQAEALFGYPREEMVGKPIEVLIPDRFRLKHAGMRHGYAHDPRTRPMGAGMDLSARRKDGREVPVEVSLGPMRLRDRLLVTAAVRDITQRKAAEQRLAEQAESLARSNRDLEQFAYVASHDLQSPLRTVISFAQLLQRRFGSSLGEKGAGYIETIVEGATRMQNLITDLLAFSRVGRGDAAPEPVNVEDILAQVRFHLAAQIRAQDAQVTNGPMPIVSGTPIELLQVLQNLVGNAIKFSRGGEAPRVHVSAVRQGGFWEFAVRDNGIGIRPEYRERIFNMFARLHDAGRYEGTGIGLAICQKIVLRHGGRIWVESEPGAGSTFRFTLPAVAEDSRTAA